MDECGNDRVSYGGRPETEADNRGVGECEALTQSEREDWSLLGTGGLSVGLHRSYKSDSCNFESVMEIGPLQNALPTLSLRRSTVFLFVKRPYGSYASVALAGTVYGMGLADVVLQKGLFGSIRTELATKGFEEGRKMSYELCAAYGNKGVETLEGDIDKWRRLGSFLTGIDIALDWVTESLDRKFVSAMERCVNEDPDKKREIKLLKRTVLVLMCVGLGISAMSIKLSVETQMAFALLG